jgi:hypothetical protein
MFTSLKCVRLLPLVEGWLELDAATEDGPEEWERLI